MIVLGIHEGHDASAAIVKNGKIIADVQEERLSRKKHSSDTPIKSIESCLEQAGITDIQELDAISISKSKTSPGLRTVFDIPYKEKLKRKIPRILAQKFFGIRLPGEGTKLPIYFKDYTSFDKEKIKNYDHHLCHAASVYYTQSDNDKQLIFTLDGTGEGKCTAIWMAENKKITLLKSYYKEASFGWAYGIVTEGLHWIHGDGEGKTMGLAPYGDYNKCKGVLDKYFPVFEKEKLVKPAEIGAGYHWTESGSNQYHFEEAKEVERLVAKYGREHIAAEAQRKLEDGVMNLVQGWVEKTGVKKTCFSGGVMLNVKLNQRIWNNREKLGVEKQYIFSNPGDSGLAAGAALMEYYRVNDFKGVTMEDLYLGPEYSNDEIKKILDIRKLKYEYVEDPSQVAAKLLSQNKIIAWFQGRMESGPRALGNRSILMSPLNPKNKETINKWVKFREGFRPFCPSLTYESRSAYLKDYRDEFFMITSFDAIEEKKDKIPAVVHVDGTLRVQMVKKETNERYWSLINEFGRLTGESIVLNTSFNVMGEPIINNPKEAIRCFFDSGIDCIFLGNYYVDKEKL